MIPVTTLTRTPVRRHIARPDRVVEITLRLRRRPIDPADDGNQRAQMRLVMNRPAHHHALHQRHPTHRHALPPARTVTPANHPAIALRTHTRKRPRGPIQDRVLPLAHLDPVHRRHDHERYARAVSDTWTVQRPFRGFPGKHLNTRQSRLSCTSTTDIAGPPEE